MSDFNKKLDDATLRMQEHIKEEKQAMEAARQTQVAVTRAREEAVTKTHGIAIHFNQNCIKAIMKQIQTKIPRGICREHSDKEDGFAGWSLEFGEGESLALKIHFDEDSIGLSAEAHCVGEGIVYSEKCESFDSAQFEETKARDWIESHALEAYEAFGQHAAAVRNQPPIVRYDRTEPGE